MLVRINIALTGHLIIILALRGALVMVQSAADTLQKSVMVMVRVLLLLESTRSRLSDKFTVLVKSSRTWIRLHNFQTCSWWLLVSLHILTCPVAWIQRRDRGRLGCWVRML